MGDLVERHRRARDYVNALGYANRILAADCWREDVVRQVMSIRYASGDASGALAEFDRFAKRLRKAMGVVPLPDARSARRYLLRRPASRKRDRISQESREASVAAAAISEAIGDRHGAARAQMNLGMQLARCGDFGGGRERLQSARADTSVRVIGARSLRRSSTKGQWRSGRRRAGREVLATDALRLSREMDHESFIATSLANLGAVKRDLGELDAALAHLDEGLAIQVRGDRLADALSDLADNALAQPLPVAEKISPAGSTVGVTVNHHHPEVSICRRVSRRIEDGCAAQC